MKKPFLNEFYTYMYAGHLWNDGYYLKHPNYTPPENIKRSELCTGDILYKRKGRNVHEYLLVNVMSSTLHDFSKPCSPINQFDYKYEFVPLDFSNSGFTKYVIEYSGEHDDELRIDRLKRLTNLSFLLKKLGCKEPDYLNVTKYPLNR